ncbi:uncharacterized protein LOC111086109 [Limulus polyphemus]|uniref:Uncharacterized protein LOC111086109 n=1 Tax=Limulus polyphemus TaxID=6850 RepID=A0ABM1SID5_LIMPO|nr:uncharacterized protein LOC111086109 [Limulus polyphemus]
MSNVTDSPDGVLSRLNCHNLTKLLGQYLMSLSSNLNLTQSENDDLQTESKQKNALMYIIVVLLFYSCGIGIMMIKYMRKEAKEQEECKMYRRYINAAHEQYLNSTNRSRLANRLALQALNTVNAIPQTTQMGSKVTFV